MQLTLEQIRSITCGAVAVKQEEGGIHFYRFTEPQIELYRARREALLLKALATSGIKLSFETDSESLFIKGNFVRASSRSYFSVDVKVNGQVIGSMDNFSDTEIPPIYTDMEFPMGRYEKKFDLGEGVKTVTVYLPWNKIVTLEALCLDDGSYIQPIRPSKKLLAFGDSITQGFDAMRNYNRQIARLAEALDAEEFSRAVGAERFIPELAALRDDFDPDYIVVAYGTNDFTGMTPSQFTDNCNAFFRNLAGHYPNAKIYAITPIWRADTANTRKFTSFFDIEKGIYAATADLGNVTVIDGQTLVPHDTKFYADGRLHPNDAGFEHYYQNLRKAILG